MKKITFVLFLFILAAGISIVSAEPLQIDSNGTVDGGVVIDAVQPVPWKEMQQNTTIGPFSRTFNHTYDVAPNANVQWGKLYVFIYSGSARNTSYNLAMNTSFLNGSTYQQIGNHQLTLDADTSSRVYPTGWNIANDTIIKNGGDYLLIYDVKNIINGQNLVNFKIDSAKLGDYKFDGRLKAMVLAYTYNLPGSSKTYKYWINIGQDFIKGRENTTPPAGTNITSKLKYDLTGSGISSSLNTTLYTLGLGSYDGKFQWDNGENISEISKNNNPTGNYSFFEFNKWNHSSINENINYENINYLKFSINYNGTYQYTPSFKLGISALVIEYEPTVLPNNKILDKFIEAKINKFSRNTYNLFKTPYPRNNIENLNSNLEFNLPIKIKYSQIFSNWLYGFYNFNLDSLTSFYIVKYGVY